MPTSPQRRKIHFVSAGSRCAAWLLVPLVGEPGSVASLTTPDSRKGAAALNPDNRYPQWQQNVAARSAIRVGFYRPGRFASRIQCPLLVLAYQQDGVAPPHPAIRAALRAPRGQLACLRGGHYAAFLDGEYQAARVLVCFLDRELRSRSGETPDEYIAGGEPGVVVRSRHEIESVDEEDKVK